MRSCWSADVRSVQSVLASTILHELRHAQAHVRHTSHYHKSNESIMHRSFSLSGLETARNFCRLLVPQYRRLSLQFSTIGVRFFRSSTPTPALQMIRHAFRKYLGGSMTGHSATYVYFTVWNSDLEPTAEACVLTTYSAMAISEDGGLRRYIVDRFILLLSCSRVSTGQGVIIVQQLWL